MPTPETIIDAQIGPLRVEIREVFPGIWLAEVPGALWKMPDASDRVWQYTLSHSGNSPEAAFNALSGLIAELEKGGYEISQRPSVPQNIPTLSLA